MDNAPVHTGNIIGDITGKRINLTSYSPELNPIVTDLQKVRSSIESVNYANSVFSYL